MSSQTTSKPIQTIITSHRTRIINHNYQQRHTHRRESHLIELKRTRDNVSKTSIQLPRVLCANVRSITSSKHYELIQQSADYDIIMKHRVSDKLKSNHVQKYKILARVVSREFMSKILCKASTTLSLDLRHWTKHGNLI